MKTRALFTVAALALGCGPAAPPADAPAPSEVKISAKACVVKGAGEHPFADAGRPALDLYTARDAATPVLRVVRPHVVGLAWSEFPDAPPAGASPSDGAPSAANDRARVELGGQQLVRLRAFASLQGRAFGLKRRAPVDPDHLWVQAGAPVQLAGLTGSKLAIVYATPFFTEPKTVVGAAECDDIAYDSAGLPTPEEAPSLVSPAGTYVTLKQGRLALSRSPGAKPFFDAVFADRKVLALHETKDGWAHVSTVAHEFGLDGWVLAEDTEPTREPPEVGSGRAKESRRAPDEPPGTPVTVAVDSALYVGRPGAMRRVDEAYFEAGAKLRELRTDGPLAEVVFEGGEIAPASSEDALWIMKSDIR